MQKAVEIVSHGLTLRGMLHVPEKVTGKIPVVCIFHGYTGHKMEPHFIFVKLSRMLEKSGIASVRFDFGGSGESDGEFKDMTLSGELSEAKDILKYAKSLEFADQDRICITGLSMGGAVAGMLAGECSESINKLCLWAPAANMSDIASDGRNAERMEVMKANGVFDIGGLALGENFVKDVLTLDIIKKSEGYKGKVLILHGSGDETVPVGTSDRYTKLYGDRADLKVIDRADHTFNSLDWEKEVLNSTVEFLKY